MHKNNFMYLTFLLGAFSVNAQEALLVTGANTSSSTGTVSYSIGQPFYISSQGTDGSLSEGVQQPYEISVVLGRDEKDIALKMKAYPNPTIDILQLYIENPENMSFILYDLNGRLLRQGAISHETTQIDMQGLPQATYFLLVKNNIKEVKSFKIIKRE
ncbi:MAG: T9SS type A sorting domain-containing protein [Flavobacterium sp.]|nr:MAG: T9SS type A sorting domain-containing protein [Flavobacterium sp.]